MKIDNNSKDLVKTANHPLVPDCLTTTASIPNCYGGYDDSGTLKCLICNRGYEVHTDGKCYKIRLDSNGDRNFNINDYFWDTIGIDSTKWRDFSILGL